MNRKNEMSPEEAEDFDVLLRKENRYDDKLSTTTLASIDQEADRLSYVLAPWIFKYYVTHEDMMSVVARLRAVALYIEEICSTDPNHQKKIL